MYYAQPRFCNLVHGFEAGFRILRTMKRYGMVIRVKPEKLEEYLRLHREVWPEVYNQLHRSNYRNFTIFHRELPDGHYLFMSYEYIGTDHEADTAKIAQDPKTQEWWKLTDPCQEPIGNAAPGEWWAPMEEVCHADLDSLLP
jgi:L-rhamnose mutarotase